MNDGEGKALGQPKGGGKKARLYGQRSSEEDDHAFTRGEDILAAISAMRMEVRSQLCESEKRMTDAVTAQISTLEGNLAIKIQELEHKVDTLQEDNDKLRESNVALSQRLNQIDRDRRRNNILITGTKASTIAEAIEESNRITKQCSPNAPDLKNVRLINQKNRRKILATCASFEHKLTIMKQKKSLKGQNGEPIFVDDDLTPEDSRNQYQLRQEAAKLRKENKEVQIRGNKLKVGDEWWQYDDKTESLKKIENWTPGLRANVGREKGLRQ